MGKSPKFDGKIYKPVTFGEGNKPGSVDWERQKRRERAEARRYRELREEEAYRNPPRGPGLMARLISGLAKLIRRREAK